MPEFQYVARELTGREVRGVVSAQTEAEAAATLSSQQLFPISVKKTTSGTSATSLFQGRVRTPLVTAFYTQLADLLRSGVPLLRALTLLEEQTGNETFRLVLLDVREDVADGARLAETLRKHPKVFDELAVSMVHAGEEGDFLEDVLQRIATFSEHQEELKSRVVGAIAYPAFLSVLGTLVVVVLLVWFVPKFQPIFDQLESGQGLPWATTLLLSVSHFLGKYAWLLILILSGTGWMIWRFLNSEQGRRIVDGWRIHFKLIGPIYRSLAVSRFCRILGTLLHNGVPILNSLRIAKDASGNVVLRDAIANAAENVSHGASLADPLERSEQFPREVIEMIRIGEEANNLETVLINIAESLEKRTYRQLDLFVRLLEPFMLLVMAAVILFVVIALLMPVFQSTGLM